MLVWVAGGGTLCTLEVSYLGVARLGGILGSQRRIKGFGIFFLIVMTPLNIVYHNDHNYLCQVPVDAVDSISFSGVPLGRANNMSLDMSK